MWPRFYSFWTAAPCCPPLSGGTSAVRIVPSVSRGEGGHMRADLLTAVVLLTLPLQVPRGAVEKVAGSIPAVMVGTPVSITVTGRNPCGAVRLNYGDGTEAITHPLVEVPATIQYTYSRPGNYEILAEGMGNCDGV